MTLTIMVRPYANLYKPSTKRFKTMTYAPKADWSGWCMHTVDVPYRSLAKPAAIRAHVDHCLGN
jgi:hypothetical protein